MNCGQCSTQIPNNLRFCPACGFKFVDDQNSQKQNTTVTANKAQTAPSSSGQPSSSSNFLNSNNSNNNQNVYVGSPAGFWLRLTAYVIDGLITGLISGIVTYFLKGEGFNPTLILFYVIGPWVYEAGLTSSSLEGTLGKKIVSLRVLDDNGERLTFVSATVRFWVKVVLWLVTLGIITIPAGVRKDKKTGYDILVRSSVYRR